MSDRQLIDHDTLLTLQEVMEDDFGRLIETYLNDSEDRLSAMQKALASGDGEALRRAAHSFKGSCSNIGAQTLVAHCQHIEQAAANNQLPIHLGTVFAISLLLLKMLFASGKCLPPMVYRSTHGNE